MAVVETAPTRPVVSPDIPSIAVLPFADMSPEKDQDYFCEGLAEELIDALSKIEGLRVVARASAFQFKGPRMTCGESANNSACARSSTAASARRGIVYASRSSW